MEEGVEEQGEVGIGGCEHGGAGGGVVEGGSARSLGLPHLSGFISGIWKLENCWMIFSAVHTFSNKDINMKS